MKHRTAFLFMLACLNFCSLGFVLRAVACTPSNTICRASGGCSVPCVDGTSGPSAEIISASQASECSPSSMSNCSGSGGLVVCGVYYHYTGPDCDSGTIDDSYPIFSTYCTPG